MKKLKLKFYLFVAEVILKASMTRADKLKGKANKTLKDCEEENTLLANAVKTARLIEDIKFELYLES